MKAAPASGRVWSPEPYTKDKFSLCLVPKPLLSCPVRRESIDVVCCLFELLDTATAPLASEQQEKS